MLVARPLFSLYREGHEEICVFGEIASVSAGAAWHSGDAPSLVPARSLLKPFQFEATGFTAGGRELGLRQVAALGSISASGPQCAELARWYARDELPPELELPPALPLDPEQRARISAAGGAAETLFHPCFSKHMAILGACERRGWSRSEYTARSHPFHRELERVLAPHLLRRSIEALEFVTDGCGLPTPVLSTLELAQLYLALAVDPALLPIRRAMLAHPDWIGGPGRVDTRLMQKNPGRVIAKEGADGLLAVACVPSPGSEGGRAWIVKLAAGYQPEWAALALAPFLDAQGITNSCSQPDRAIVWHVGPDRAPVEPRDVSPLLHDGVAVWPGDVPYRRHLTTEIGASVSPSGPAWELTVSSVHTTLHVGAHADAPNHFTAGGRGIESAPLSPYRGLCQVIECNKPRGSLLAPSDLDRVTLRAPRLLFKTSSFPDPDAFNTDFVAFAPGLIAWLIERGAVLIGIDTPSEDAFDSKSLPAHHATREGHGVSILEGLDLRDVTPGLYELIALPLKLGGADASPVRATLWPLR